MKSIDEYPHGGTQPLGRPKNPENCRHGQCLELQLLTGRNRCAYCGVDLTHDYHTWLLMSVDHVVLRQDAVRLHVPKDLYEDFTNLVLCCSGCNGFANRYEVPPEIAEPHDDWTPEDFYRVRDDVYRDKYVKIAKRREEEMAFFDGKPWGHQDED